MHADLIRIQMRLEQYDVELQRIVRLYSDELSMSNFSDRFGADHPESALADEGVRIQQRLRRMNASLREFATQFEAEFPSLDNKNPGTKHETV